MRTFAVYARWDEGSSVNELPTGCAPGAGLLVSAWTAKGARRKWRRRVRQIAPRRKLCALTVYEVTSALAPNGNHIIQETRVA